MELAGRGLAGDEKQEELRGLLHADRSLSLPRHSAVLADPLRLATVPAHMPCHALLLLAPQWPAS